MIYGIRQCSYLILDRINLHSVTAPGMDTEIRHVLCITGSQDHDGRFLGCAPETKCESGQDTGKCRRDRDTPDSLPLVSTKCVTSLFKFPGDTVDRIFNGTLDHRHDQDCEGERAGDQGISPRDLFQVNDEYEKTKDTDDDGRGS